MASFSALLDTIARGRRVPPGRARETRLLAGLVGAFEANVGMLLRLDPRPRGPMPVAQSAVGLDARDAAVLGERLRRRLADVPRQRPRDGAVTVAHARLAAGAPDRARPAGHAEPAGDLMLAWLHAQPGGRGHAIGLYRHSDQWPFREEACELLRVFLGTTRWLLAAEAPPGPGTASAVRPATTADVNGLPRRLRQVLLEVLAGHDAAQIAHRLHLSRHTVYEHMGRLYRREGVRNRHELAARFCALTEQRRPVPRG